jgi:hypothetical protein
LVVTRNWRAVEILKENTPRWRFAPLAVLGLGGATFNID